MVNGFCEMLIESMLKSKLKRKRIEEASEYSLTSWLIAGSPLSSNENSQRVKKQSESNYKCQLKLRNLFYLIILLKMMPFLKDYRVYRLKNKKNTCDTDKNESVFDSFDRLIVRKFKVEYIPFFFI